MPLGLIPYKERVWAVQMRRKNNDLKRPWGKRCGKLAGGWLRRESQPASEESARLAILANG